MAGKIRQRAGKVRIMNPVHRLNIDTFEEIVDEIGKIRSETFLTSLEEKFVNEVVTLVLEAPPKEAKSKLHKIKQFIVKKRHAFFRRPLYSAFLNASQGAIDAALYCL